MKDLDYKITSEYTEITETPYYLYEPVEGSGEFNTVFRYASTKDNKGYFKIDSELILGKDIEEVDNPGKFRFRFLISKYPGNLIEALRDYAKLRGCSHVSMDFYLQNWNFYDDGKIIAVKPRLFVPVFDTGVDLNQSFSEGLGIDPRFLR